LETKEVRSVRGSTFKFGRGCKLEGDIVAKQKAECGGQGTEAWGQSRANREQDIGMTKSRCGKRYEDGEPIVK
jgi:hypothetical protein